MQKDESSLVELLSDKENTHEISSSFIQSSNAIVTIVWSSDKTHEF